MSSLALRGAAWLKFGLAVVAFALGLSVASPLMPADDAGKDSAEAEMPAEAEMVGR
jgi:hypothetical protein